MKENQLLRDLHIVAQADDQRRILFFQRWTVLLACSIQRAWNVRLCERKKRRSFCATPRQGSQRHKLMRTSGPKSIFTEKNCENPKSRCRLTQCMHPQLNQAHL